MHHAHLLSFDLNLLMYLYALLEEKHVTRAAVRCSLSQPAMSRAFLRLREELGDDLLVRNGRRGYVRTPRGERLFQELTELLPRLESALRGEEFSPSTSQERFKVVGTDHAATVIVPGMVRYCREVAPNVRIDMTRWGDNGYLLVESGECDLALGVGSAPSPPPSLKIEVLFEEELVCLVDAADAYEGDAFDSEKYLQRRHAQVTIVGGEQTLVDRPLREVGLVRSVAYSSPYFVPTMMAVIGTDLVVTVPRSLANAVHDIAGLRQITPPKEIGKFSYVMGWHPRLTGDPAHAWFRQVVRATVKSWRTPLRVE